MQSIVNTAIAEQTRLGPVAIDMVETKLATYLDTFSVIEAAFNTTRSNVERAGRLLTPGKAVIDASSMIEKILQSLPWPGRSIVADAADTLAHLEVPGWVKEMHKSLVAAVREPESCESVIFTLLLPNVSLIADGFMMVGEEVSGFISALAGGDLLGMPTTALSGNVTAIE